MSSVLGSVIILGFRNLILSLFVGKVPLTLFQVQGFWLEKLKDLQFSRMLLPDRFQWPLLIMILSVNTKKTVIS